MSSGDKPTRAVRSKRKRPYQVMLDLGEMQSSQIEDIRKEILARDGIQITRVDAVRRCIAYAWRHARLKGWGPP